jgi:hypothetical protein
MKRILLFPIRFTALLRRDEGRIAKIILLVLVFLTALYTKNYRGQYEMTINNNIGGVFYVLFGSLLISVLFPRLKLYLTVLLALGLTCLLEVIQYFRIAFMLELAENRYFAYLFGNSFNPRDFNYYIIGAALGILVLWLLKGEEVKREKRKVKSEE